MIGTRTLRLEDEPLLRGRGRFVDDIAIPGVLHAAFVRSPHAHAMIRGIDTAAARATEGGRAVFTAADLAGMLTHLRLPIAFPAGQLPAEAMPLAMAETEVLYAGETVA